LGKWTSENAKMAQTNKEKEKGGPIQPAFE
jgi:hypothetical protein